MKICFEAVRQDGYSLQFVKNKTEEICFEAVRKSVLALRYVPEEIKSKWDKIIENNIKGK